MTTAWTPLSERQRARGAHRAAKALTLAVGRALGSAWGHRPQVLHLGLFVGAYVLGAGFAHSLAIVPGTGISIWPPSGVFITTLIFAARRSWPWWILGGFFAEMLGNFLWFENPLPVAILLNAGNALEAA